MLSRQEAEIHVVIGLDRPGRLEVHVAVVDGRSRRARRAEQTALGKGVVVDFLVGQRRDVEVALVGQIERELQAGDEVALGRRQEVVFGVGVGADFERDVMQRPDAEGLGVEDFVPAEGGAEQAVDFGRASAIGRATGDRYRRRDAGQAGSL